MSRDYKPKSNSRPSTGRGGSMFAGILIGLILGLGIALAVAWYINKMPSPFLNRRPEPTQPPPPLAANPPSPSGESLDKPKFDFYKMLPGQNVPVITNKPSQAPTVPAPSGAFSENYYLQAGAFQKKDDADNMKAKLAMLGLESDVQSVKDASGNESRFRVRIGPYQSERDLKIVQDNLQQNGITATVVKIKETSQ